MLVDHILSTAGDDVIVLGFENRARREREREKRERSRVVCVTLEKKKRKKTCKICLV
jgi:hypothetical protein